MPKISYKTNTSVTNDELMTKDIYDANNNNIVDEAEVIAIVYVAGENLTKGDVIWVHTDGKAYKASSSNVNIMNKVVGFSKEDATAGNNVLIEGSGSLTVTAWSLLPGESYFLSINGGISLYPPDLTSVFIQRVGVAINSTTIEVNIGEAIRLSEPLGL
jgi:hypothetical protein